MEIYFVCTKASSVHFLHYFFVSSKVASREKSTLPPPPSLVPWSKLMAMCERRRRFHSSTGRNGFPNQFFVDEIGLLCITSILCTSILFKCTNCEQCFILTFFATLCFESENSLSPPPPPFVRVFPPLPFRQAAAAAAAAAADSEEEKKGTDR